MYKKFYSNLIRCLGTYFSKEISQKINAKIDYFVFIIILNFLSSLNLFADSANSSNVVFSIIIIENLRKFL